MVDTLPDVFQAEEQVPPKVERISKLKLYTDVSQVVYQLAVTAASLKVLDIF